MTAETHYCEGCGVPIQTEYPQQSGYVPTRALEREHVICQRCYRIRHYNEVTKTDMTADDYRAILHDIAEVDALVVQVIDIFDLAGSWVRGIHRFIGQNPLLLVANKIDLLPGSLNRKRLADWLQRSAKEEGLRPLDIVMCSVAKNIGVDSVVEKMEAYRDGRDVYVVGATNVGKSSLINRLLKDYGEGEGDEITVSRYPGTTLNTIRIPLEGDRQLVDTPGIVNADRLSEHVKPEEVQVIVPQKTIHPKVYQLNPGQTLFFGGLARIDFHKGDRQPFVCYVSPDLYLHRTKTERAAEVYDIHVGELLIPPSDYEALPAFVKRSYRIHGEKTDIVIAGLGWVACRGDVAEIDVYVPEGIGVSLRQAII